MDTLLDSIHIAVGDGASADDRQRGVAACRALADALEDAGAPIETTTTEASAPLTAPPEERPEPVAAPLKAPSIPPVPTPLSLGLGPNPFAGMTADQVLDLAIARLRSAVGDAAGATPAGDPFRLTLVPVPRLP